MSLRTYGFWGQVFREDPDRIWKREVCAQDLETGSLCTGPLILCTGFGNGKFILILCTGFGNGKFLQSALYRSYCWRRK